MTLPDATVPVGTVGQTCPFAAALVAVDPATGSAMWSHCAGVLSGIEVLAATGSTVLAAEYGAMDGGVHLLGLDAATGEQRWSTDIAPFNESYERDAFYADGERAGAGVVVVNVLDGGRTMVVGLDVETGAERWRADAERTFVTGHTADVAIAMAPGAMFETPADAAQPDLLALGFDRRTGEVRWRRANGIRDVGAPWGPRLGDGLFVFTQIDPRAEDSTPQGWRWDTVAVDAATGTERWRRERGPLLVLAVSDGTGVGLEPGPAEDRQVLDGFDSATGDVRWELPLPAGNPLVWAAPGAPVAAVLVVPGTEPTDGTATTASATTAGGTMAAEVTSGALAVVDRSSGRVRYTVPGAQAAAVSEQLVLVGRGGEVIALDASDGAVRWRLPFAHPYGIEVQRAGARLFLSSSAGLMDPPPMSNTGVATDGSTASGAGSPASNVRLSGGVELGTFELPDGSPPVHFVETPETGGERYLCVAVVGADTAAGCLLERDEPSMGPPGFAMPTSSAPVRILLRSSTLAAIRLPAGHARPVTVRDAATGASWPAVEATDRDVLYVLDPNGSGSSELSTLIEVVGPDGTVLVRSGPASSLGSSGPTASGTAGSVPAAVAAEDWAGQLAACYRANGTDYRAALTGGSPLATAPSTPLPPEIAVRAWQACEQLLAPGLPPAADRTWQTPAYFDCMAAAGWLAPFWVQHAEQWGPASLTCGRDPALS